MTPHPLRREIQRPEEEGPEARRPNGDDVLIQGMGKGHHAAVMVAPPPRQQSQRIYFAAMGNSRLLAITAVAVGAVAVIAASVLTPKRPRVEVRADPRVGREVRLVGCERGELVVPTVDLWDTPERSRVVAHFAVGAVADRSACEGVPVIIRGVRDDLGVLRLSRLIAAHAARTGGSDKR